MKPLSTSLWLVLVAGLSTQQLAAQSTSQHDPFISRDCLWYADQSIEQMLKLTPDQITALNDIRITGMSGAYALKGDTGEVDRPTMKALIQGGKWVLTPVK